MRQEPTKLKSKRLDIRVLLVDDHEMVRQGLIYFLSTQQGIEVVGQAENGFQAVEMVAELSPDVVLMDLVMPDMDGIEAAIQIKEVREETAVLALTSYVDQEKVIDALSAGMAGYIMKDVSSEELTRAIRAAAKDEIYLSSEAAKYVARQVRTKADQTPAPTVLTHREIDVLCLLARGLNNTDIGTELNISIKTVKTHVSSILNKLQLENRTQAALYALRHNLISLDET
ncbi:MAG: DNA-binding response regulator [Chloroflexi bacterium]|nr:MAG: DNA-binding response regulator [Chloroflexota bacterium]